MLTLRPYQQAAIASIYGYFEKESGNPLVVIPSRRRRQRPRPTRKRSRRAPARPSATASPPSTIWPGG